MIENWCNINGVLVPECEATVPVLDRGFLFGDSIYEVIRTRLGVPYTWREHLDRLHRSAAAIVLSLDIDDRELMQRIVATTERARSGDASDQDLYVRIVVTRGTGSAPNIGLQFAPGPSTTVLIVRQLPAIAGKPSRLALIPRLRNDPRALDPAVKSGNYLNNVLGLAEAKAVGATDCLFMNAEGHATEASTANFYLVEGGTIATPPLAAGLLSGVTRSMLEQCAAEADIPFIQRDITKADIGRADELFLSSTGRDISPITHVDGRQLHASGDGGPFTAGLVARFQAFCERRVREVDAPGLDALLG